MAPAPQNSGTLVSLERLGHAPASGAGPAPLIGAPLARPDSDLRQPRSAPLGLAEARPLVRKGGVVRAAVPYGAALALAPAQASQEPAPARASFVPSLAGLGLDEARLVRTGAAKIGDPGLVSGKLDAPTGPRLAIPCGPAGLVGLGWSSSASLAALPSFKVARGGLVRRPMSGLRAAPNAVGGLPAPLEAPLAGKAGALVGAGRLSLWAPTTGARAHAGATLDAARHAWAPVWAFVGPAPTEDLDPSFINTVWTPETNTTRRSDHNSRYLVTWGPLGRGLTEGGAFGADLSGPASRMALAPLSVRTSLLAVNEAGLKNTQGGLGAQARLGQLTLAPRALGGSTQAPTWAALWAFVPAFGASPQAFVGRPKSAVWASGRAASVTSAQALLGAGGALESRAGGSGSGHGLVALLASLDLTRGTGHGAATATFPLVAA
jgi:hypothetical protein